nr:LysR family substrate-binding domain-containing protein [uncultured Brevundimonas sp.]
MTDARLAGVGQVGQLRIGLTFSFLSEALYRLIDCFHGAHPSVLIEMVEGRAEDHLRAVADQRLDVAVLPGGITVTGLDVSILWRERLVIAIPLSHPLASIDIIRTNDLSGMRVLVSAGDIGRVALNLFGGVCPGPDVAMQEVGAAVLLDQSRMGLGMAILGEGSLKGLRPGPDFIVRPIAFETDEPLAVAAAWCARNDNPVLRRFVSATRRR